MNFIEVTDLGVNKVLINIREISEIMNTEDGKCIIYLKSPEVFYKTEESYEEIKMKLLRCAGMV